MDCWASLSIGAPPGYVGYDDPPIFEAVRENARTVFLFDELDKAHPEVLKMFLSVLDEGRITARRPGKDGQRELDFRQCIFVFTSNADLTDRGGRRMGFSDVVAIFLAMDSYVELFKGGVVPLEEFARMPYDNDILVRLIVKKRPGAFAYQAVRKQRTDLPTLNCAAAKVGDEYRLVVGSRPARAVLLRDDQGILAGGITEESAAAFADYAVEAVPVSGNMWGSAEYRRALVPVLARRTLLALGEVR